MTTTKRFAALSALALVLALLAGGGALAQRVESRLEGLIDDVAGLAMSLGVSSPMYTDTDLRESIQQYFGYVPPGDATERGQRRRAARRVIAREEQATGDGSPAPIGYTVFGADMSSI